MFRLPDHFGLFTDPAKKAEREAKAIARMQRWAEAISEDPLKAEKAWDRECNGWYYFGVVVGIVVTVVTFLL